MSYVLRVQSYGFFSLTRNVQPVTRNFIFELLNE